MIFKNPLILCSIFVICLFGSVQGQVKIVRNPHHKRSSNAGLASYEFPKNHPLSRYLRVLLRDSDMFQSPDHFRNAGFQVKLGHRRLMVGFHPSIPKYAIKKFSDQMPQKMQLINYIQRIKGAKILRKYIQEHNFTHLAIPKKWLYKLPRKFSKNREGAYVLIVENMDIYDDWDDPEGEARKLYYQMDKKMVTELCMILHDVGGCDAYPWNQPFTHSGKIAFVDTEHVGVRKFHDYFIRHIVPALFVLKHF